MKVEQLELFNPKSQNSPSLTESVSDTKMKSLLRFLNRSHQDTIGGVGTYQPSGSRKVKYFRFSYRVGTKTKHKHIRGGNIYSQLAFKRAQQIQGMADRGVAIEQILATIDKF